MKIICWRAVYGADSVFIIQVCLLENTRFHPEETSNDSDFAQQLAKLCDVFVMDAFGVCHRDQASVTGVTAFVSECYPGPLVRQEVTYLIKHISTEPIR